MEDLETNPLPNSYIIKVEDIELADNLVNSIKTLDGVEEVKYYKDIIDKLLNFASYIRIGGMIIIAAKFDKPPKNDRLTVQIAPER